MADKQIILSEEALNDSVPGKGLYGGRSLEKVPRYDPTGCEQVIDNTGNNTNAFIVLGNDRESSKASGKGGAGYTQCGKIDLIAGLNYAGDPNTKKRNPNFAQDAARVYISQKSNIDKFLGLVEGSELQSSDDKSTVAIKADHVRMVARNHIKLVTGAFRGTPSEKDTMGKDIDTAGKIDLIAGNTNSISLVGVAGMGQVVKSLQPLVKGDNLEFFLRELLDLMTDIQNQVFANKKSILEVALNYQSHIHISPFMGLPTAPSPMAIAVAHTVGNLFTDLPSAFTIESNLASLSENYLNPNLALYIKSKSVNTT